MRFLCLCVFVRVWNCLYVVAGRSFAIHQSATGCYRNIFPQPYSFWYWVAFNLFMKIFPAFQKCLPSCRICSKTLSILPRRSEMLRVGIFWCHSYSEAEFILFAVCLLAAFWHHHLPAWRCEWAMHLGKGSARIVGSLRTTVCTGTDHRYTG